MSKDSHRVAKSVALAGAARGLFLGLAALLMASSTAHADPTTLICNPSNNMSIYVEDGPTTIELDEAQSTIVIHHPSWHVSDPTVSGGGGSASTQGPVRAVFGTDMISFSNNGLAQTINRLTGEYDIQQEYVVVRYMCQPGKKMF